LKENEKEVERVGDYVDVRGWSSGDGVCCDGESEGGGGRERNTIDGGDDGVVIMVKVMLEMMVELSPEWSPEMSPGGH